MSHDDLGEQAVSTDVSASLPPDPAIGANEDVDPTVEVDPTAAMAEVILQTRRAVVPSIVIGVVGLIVGVITGELLAAVGLCIGLGLGMANARMLRTSVQRRFETLVETPGTKTHFLSGGAVRLGVLTGVTLLAVVLVQPLGLGMIVGMIIFQITMLVLAGASMLKVART